jgi:hypothetical protein
MTLEQAIVYALEETAGPLTESATSENPEFQK